ncbi:MAG: response regulator, partial [Candidatus Promineifilaceae bacterium]|nr:response regulator [Candidatus Promineifilaceae bacterium]
MMATAHILVVDDEPEIANSLADYLAKKGGHTVTKAYGGGEALSLLQDAAGSPAGTVDLVVLDRRMPGTSGLEVLERMREDPSLEYTRVVMLTGASGSQEKVEALSSGADDYITKPYYPEELLARVESILRTQRLEKQLQQQSQQLAALNQVSNAITTTLDIGDIPEAAAGGTREVLGTGVASLYLWDQAAGVLRCRAVADEGGGLTAGDYELTPAGAGAVGTAHAEQRTLCINDPEGDGTFQAEFDAPAELTVDNLLATPLVVRGRSIGVLSTANKEGPFTGVDVDL